MARKRPRKSAPPASTATVPGELVVVTRREAAFRSSAGRFESASGQNVSDLASVLRTLTTTYGNVKGIAVRV